MVAIAEPAASIMLIRDSAKGLEVLMMKRAETMAFAPGAYVFPGGKVDSDDKVQSHWRAYIDSRVWSSDMPYRLAALRELQEEAGVTYVRGVHRTIHRQVGFRAWLRGQGAQLATRALVPFAHWVTPEPIPKRYDTHFFLAPVLGAMHAIADGNEATKVQWVNVRQTLKNWEAGRIPLMFPTRLNLMKLSQCDTVVGAIAHARRTPVAEVLPVITQDGKARRVEIAGGAGFGAAAATEREMMVEVPARSP